MIKENTFSFEYFKNYNDLNAIEKKLFEAAQNARNNAYAPYSNFLVGCAIQMENGEIITGNNQENAAYPSGLCAERVAVYYASSIFPNIKMKKIFILGGPINSETHFAIPPCGSCRQSLLEYESKQENEIELYFAGLNGEVYKTKSISNLLPFSFDSSLLK